MKPGAAKARFLKRLEAAGDSLDSLAPGNLYSTLVVPD